MEMCCGLKLEGGGSTLGIRPCFLSTDATGNAYIAGDEGLTTVFGSPLIYTGGATGYVVKFGPNGNVIWAKTGTSPGSTNGFSPNAISTDAIGNSFVVGNWSTGPSSTLTLVFGTSTLTGFPSSGGSDIYIAKYDVNGNALWAKSAGGITGNVNVRDVCVDATGNSFITGYYGTPTLVFGTTYTLTNTWGAEAIFIAKYDPSGNLLWAKSVKGPSTYQDEGHSVRADASGNVFLTGYFRSPTITLGTYTLTNAKANAGNMFIAKYDPLGNVLWAKAAGNAGGGPSDWNEGEDVSTDMAGNAYVTGFCTFSPIIFGTYSLTVPMGGASMFVVKYDATGNVLCTDALSDGGSGSYGSQISATRYGGTAYIGGRYFYNPFVVGTTSLTPTGGQWSSFVAKYSCSASTQINENTIKQEINIFPNPAREQFTIDMDTECKLIVDMFDVSGRQVFNKNANNRSTIDVSTQNEGVYNVRITTSQSIINKKLVILR